MNTTAESTISPAELHRLLTSDAAATVLDVRTPVEFAEVHVPQALNEPLSSLNPAALAAEGRVSATEPVYLLCRSGARATQAAEKFARGGFPKAVVVEGGTQAWIEAGLPVTRGTVKVMSLERQVRIAAGTIVLLGIILSRLVHPAFVGLSAFVGAGLIFAGITDWCGMGLLLAKLPWNTRIPN